MFEQIKKDRLYKLIVERITKSILSGQMRPGDQLPTEPVLAEQFGVSRTVVREAIKALHSQGLVEVTQGRGTFITPPPMEMVTNSFHLLFALGDPSSEELIVARRIIEVPIARMAAEHIDGDGIVMLRSLLNKMEASLGDAEAFINFDTAFHAELARATGNRVLIVMIEPIIDLMKNSREAAMRVPDMADRALGFHQRIYAAVAAHNADAAERCMQDHLSQVEEDMHRASKAATTAARKSARKQSSG
jgi:GntR family transcriptional repressor for pyruvate dehydrogenase complex